jgi:UDP-N-acetylmuramate dehydrogenase
VVSDEDDGRGDRGRAPLDAAGALDLMADLLGARARRHAPLGARTTYRVGGPAGLFVEAHGEDDLVAVHHALATVGSAVPFLVLGDGSNLLVADAGFPGLVLRLGAGFEHVHIGASSVRAGAAAKLPVVARQTAAAGLHGMEWAVGVPGSVGGALRMNAGGHGSDIATVLSRVRIFDVRTGGSAESGADRLALGYRTSSLDTGDVVVWADFSLQAGDAARAERAVGDIVRWRRAHQPGGSNAGSTFINPADDSAGRLIESVGLKGYRLGSAQVSPKHANFIQADRGGSADDVWRLMEHLRAEVAERTGVTLVPEVRLVGFPGDVPTVKPSTSTEGEES